MAACETLRRQVNSVGILLDDVYKEALVIVTASNAKHGVKASAGDRAIKIAREYRRDALTADQAKKKLRELHKL